MPFKRKAEITLQGIKLTIDLEDEMRVAVEDWKADIRATNPVFYRSLGPLHNPYQQTLAAFITGADHGVYVEQITPGRDYRKSNLRVSPRSGVKPKGAR
jgi:hypothetical protein